MVIVDTSVWVDFLRAGDGRLGEWITSDQILQHPYVTAEIGMGSFRSVHERSRVIDLLESFEQVKIADDRTFHGFVSANTLFGTGIGFADAQLIYSCTINPDARLVTRDKRLAEQAQRLEIQLI
jgi:predicted nucleic acid-binding protein